MKVAPETEDDKAGKAALFTKYVEALPHALHSWKDTGLGLVSRLLLGIQKVVQHNTALHQNLFRSAAPHCAERLPFVCHLQRLHKTWFRSVTGACMPGSEVLPGTHMPLMTPCGIGRNVLCSHNRKDCIPLFVAIVVFIFIMYWHIHKQSCVS